jgi:glyoxylase-like metal-dependent hydrolase (beta-lactamase superfamily II)
LNTVRVPGALRAVALAVAALAACGGDRDAPTGSAPALFDARWNSGLDEGEPPFQSQAIDSSTFAIRQSIRTTFEAPFIYLLLGRERALLIDTGAGGGGLRAEVERHIAAWRRDTGAPEPGLVVMHSHGHTDHVGDDGEFRGRANTSVVGHSPEEVAAFFGIPDWPRGSTTLDLGGRLVDVLPTPGHQAAHVVVFDRATRIVFTGDFVYPGLLRFQCGNVAQYAESLERLRDFASRNDARWLLGGHVEMKAAPGRYYSSPDRSRRDERRVELTPPVLTEIAAALDAMKDAPRVEAYADFVLFPHPADPAGLRPPDWCND